jgi:phosphonate transport system substrate-binding protein
MHNFRGITVLVALMVFVSACGNSVVMPEPQRQSFTLGLLPTEAAVEMNSKATDLEGYLSEAMNMEVTVQIPSSYEALIQALKFGHIDAAFFDAGPAALAHNDFGAEIVLAEVKKGNTSYDATLFVRADETEILTPADIIGKNIAFTSWTGSSGFLYPMGTLVSQGDITLQDESLEALQQSLDTSFDNYMFSGGYTQSLNALLSGQVDMVGGASDAPERFLDTEDQSKLKVLATLGKVPSHPVVVRPDVTIETREAFVQAMLGLNEPEYIDILVNLYGVDGLVTTTTEEHLAEFDEIIEALPAIKEKLLSKTH